MNDNEVLTAVRDSFSGVRMRTPLEQAVRRGRVLRARRRGYRAAALAGVALAAAAVTTVNLAAAPAKPPALAAWTVTVNPDHTVSVTLRQLSDAAGLQQTLRRDGIPARVAFQPGEPSTSPPLPAGCRKPAISNMANIALQTKIIGGYSSGTISHPVAFTLSPRAIPPGIGVYVAIESGSPHSDGSWGVSEALVQATRSCTG